MTTRGMRKRRGFTGWAWRLLLLVLVWLLGVAAYIVWVGERDQAAEADVIIVLGAAAYDANPSPVFEERIRHGIDLYKRGLAERRLFTGGFGHRAGTVSYTHLAGLQLIAPTVSMLWVSSRVRAPARADASAASVPAWPPPITMTS